MLLDYFLNILEKVPSSSESNYKLAYRSCLSPVRLLFNTAQIFFHPVRLIPCRGGMACVAQ